MPRDNNRPFDCKDCKFNIDGECRRNPPVTVPVPHLDVGQNKALWDTSVGTWFPRADRGCFAGEPRVEKVCKTCSSFVGCDICKAILDCTDSSITVDNAWCCAYSREKDKP